MARRIPSLFLKSALLAFESQQVIALRMMRIAAGGATAKREMRRMVSEKVQTATQTGLAASMSIASGKSVATVAGTTLTRYRARVRKNRSRLMKG